MYKVYSPKLIYIYIYILLLKKLYFPTILPTNFHKSSYIFGE